MAVTLGTAVLGSALLGGGASLLGASRQASAARDAGRIQQQATDRSIDLQQSIWNDQRGIYQNEIARQEPVRQAGLGALDLLMEQYGIPNQSRAPAGAPGAGGQAIQMVQGADGVYAPAPATRSTASGAAEGSDAYWDEYGAMNPDLQQEWQRIGGRDPRFQDDDDFYRWHRQNHPAETRPMPQLAEPAPVSAPAALPSPETAQRQPAEPDNAWASQMTRPEGAPAPVFARPDAPAAPTFSRPDAPTLDLSLNAFTTSPGYEFRKQQGMGVVESSKALGSLLKSGAAVKDAMRFGDGLAADEYDRWAQRQIGLHQFNTGRTDQNFAVDRDFDYNAWSRNLNRQDNNFALDRDFDYNAWARNLARGDAIFTEDRGYNTGRIDKRTGDLFSIANLGQNAAGQAANLIGGMNSAGQNYASNVGNLMTTNAGNQGQATVGAANAWAQGLGGVAGAANGALSTYIMGNALQAQTPNIQIASSNPYALSFASPSLTQVGARTLPQLSPFALPKL